MVITVDQAELKWARQNSPQITMSSDKLTVWNYPVGKADLPDTFATAITNFLIDGITGGSPENFEISIRGHASASGEGNFDNTALSQSRADAVARFVRQLGFTKVNVSAAGSSEPIDSSNFGQALARNRRVDITSFLSRSTSPPPQQPAAPTPSLAGSNAVAVSLGRDAPSSGSSADAKNVASFTIAGKLEIPLTSGTSGDLDWTASFEVNFELRETKEGSNDPRAIKGVTDGKNLSAKCESQLRDWVKAKISIDPPSKDKPGSFKFGGQLTSIPNPLRPEIGLQTKPQFVYMTVEFLNLALGAIELNGIQFQVIIKGTAKLEFGLSKRALAKIAARVLSAADAAEAAAAAGLSADAIAAAGLGGGVVITLTMLAALPWLVENSKQNMLDKASKISTCDGVGAKAALEILGPVAATAYESRKGDFRTAGALSAFNDGVDLIKDRLSPLSPGNRSALLQQWKDKYAQNQDYNVVAAAVAMKLGMMNIDGPRINVNDL